MTVLVDTSVIIDYLRGQHGAEEVLERERLAAPLHASEITRLEVLAGMRRNEEGGTRLFLSVFIWHPVDTLIAESAGELGRKWLASHRSIDGADLAIAATAIVTGCELLTCNVKHFPMFTDLKKPY
ncbi:MAG TPA: type II toxin-antitoxin system VapC family toxin [Acidimicrobiales bacterium]